MSSDARASQRALVALIAIPVAGFGLVLASMAPGAYGTSAPPPPRALVIPQFAITCLIACWGYALGVRLRAAGGDRTRARLTSAFAVAAAALIVVTTAASLAATLRRATELRAWSASWDAVDRQLRAVHDAGERQAVVPAIGGVGSITNDAGDWVNICAARYYGLDRITGVAVRQ